MANILNIINTIRDNATDNYQTLIPVATRDNLSQVGARIIEFQGTMNEFLNSLVNRIGLTLIKNKTYNNPLSVLKSGNLPLGSVIQEIYANPAVGDEYDMNSQDLLKVVMPDVKALYYELNRKGKYTVSIFRNMIQQAFVSEQGIQDLIDFIVITLYSGDNIDEFELIKALYANGIVNKQIITSNINPVIDKESAKDLIKAVKTASGYFQFASDKWNTLNKTYNTTTGLWELDTGKTPARTWVEKENQIILVRTDILAQVGVEVLATAFNLDPVTFQQNMLEFDALPLGADNCALILMDKAHCRVFENVYESRSFENPDNLSIKYYLHHWQVYAFALFANCVAFMEVEPTT